MNMQPAPAFVLNNQNGEARSLDNYHGRWLVLYFYPRDNTSGCTREASDFTDSLDDFEKLGCTVVGVSPDTVATHQKFIDKYNLGIELLSDPEKQIIKAYGAWGEKTLYGKKTEGLIRSTFLINPEGLIAYSWHAVKVRIKKAGGETKHTDTVRQKLAELKNNLPHN